MRYGMRILGGSPVFFFLRDLRFLDAESVENPRVYVCIKYYI